MIMLAAALSPATFAASSDSASVEEQRQARQQSATAYREMRQAINPTLGGSAEEVRWQSLQMQASIRREAQRQAAAEKDAARRAEASRLIMERNAKN
jgi:hypothetical protein